MMVHIDTDVTRFTRIAEEAPPYAGQPHDGVLPNAQCNNTNRVFRMESTLKSGYMRSRARPLCAVECWTSSVMPRLAAVLWHTGMNIYIYSEAQTSRRTKTQFLRHAMCGSLWNTMRHDAPTRHFYFCGPSHCEWYIYWCYRRSRNGVVWFKNKTNIY